MHTDFLSDEVSDFESDELTDVPNEDEVSRDVRLTVKRTKRHQDLVTAAGQTAEAFEVWEFRPRAWKSAQVSLHILRS